MHEPIIYDFTLSDHWLSPLINGDYSGLEDAEATLFDSFLESLPKHEGMHGVWDYSGEDGFFARDDVTDLYANCFNVTLTFI
jgi:hypothetical protein